MLSFSQCPTTYPPAACLRHCRWLVRLPRPSRDDILLEQHRLSSGDAFLPPQPAPLLPAQTKRNRRCRRPLPSGRRRWPCPTFPAAKDRRCHVCCSCFYRRCRRSISSLEQRAPPDRSGTYIQGRGGYKTKWRPSRARYLPTGIHHSRHQPTPGTCEHDAVTFLWLPSRSSPVNKQRRQDHRRAPATAEKIGPGRQVREKELSFRGSEQPP